MEVQTPGHLPTHFTELMKSTFQERALKNPSYSLRAFARDLGMTSGNLSDVLNLKVGISQEKAQLIAAKLLLPIEDQELFLKLVEISSATNSAETEKLKNELLQFDSSYLKINDDYYHVLTEWFYFALVELVRVTDFINDDEWIARRLNISTEDVRPAIERLKRVELLNEDNGKLTQTYDYFVSPSGTPSTIARKFHKQILSKAITAIEEQEIEERDYTSGFLRVRKNDLPMISEKIKNFRRSLAAEIESGENHDSVYAFSIQFFRGDHEKK
jgi:uncharacterized protein (TIGR02147 family)